MINSLNAIYNDVRVKRPFTVQAGIVELWEFHTSIRDFPKKRSSENRKSTNMDANHRIQWSLFLNIMLFEEPAVDFGHSVPNPSCIWRAFGSLMPLICILWRNLFELFLWLGPDLHGRHFWELMELFPHRSGSCHRACICRFSSLSGAEPDHVSSEKPWRSLFFCEALPDIHSDVDSSGTDQGRRIPGTCRSALCRCILWAGFQRGRQLPGFRLHWTQNQRR